MVTVDFAKVFSGAYSKLSPEAKATLEGKQPQGSGPDIDQEIDKTQKKLEESAKRIQRDQKGFLDKTKEGFARGGQSGTMIENDLNELKSGRFAGIFERSFNTVKSIKDTYSEIFGEKSKQAKEISKQFEDIKEPKNPFKDENSSGSGGSSPGLPSIGGTGGNGQIQELTSKELKTDKSIFEKAEFKNVKIPEGFPGFPKGGKGPGGGSGSANPADAASDSSNKFGLVIGGIAAASLKLMSSLAGMYQNAMQGQDSTLDSMGYVGSGGALTTNAEMAQIGLRRAKIMGGEGRDQLNNKLGVQFGLRQGIGGTEGAETFAKLSKFTSFKEDREEFKRILAMGIKGGFEGLRQSEMFSRIASMSEQSYLSGYGKSNVFDTSSIVAALSKKGIGSDNALSMTENLQKKFQEDGSTFQNMVISQKIQEFKNDGLSDSDAYLRAKAFAQDSGNLRGNVQMVSEMMKKSGLSDSQIGVFLEQQGIATAKQLVDVKDKVDPITGQSVGEVKGSYNILETSASDFRVGSGDYLKATEEFKKTVRVGQSYRATANKIDNLVVSSAVAQTAYMAQLKITSGIIEGLSAGDQGIRGLFGGEKRYDDARSQNRQNEIERLKKSGKTEEQAKELIQKRSNAFFDPKKIDSYARIGLQIQNNKDGFLKSFVNGATFDSNKNQYAAIGMLDNAKKSGGMTEETGRLLVKVLEKLNEKQIEQIAIMSDSKTYSKEQLMEIKKGKGVFR